MEQRATDTHIRGVIEHIVYHNDDNDYTVLELADTDGNLITAVGTVPFAAEGEELTLEGSYTYHKEYGRQFVISSYEKNLPTDTDSILKYLSSRTVKGVGPVTALKIVNRFGEQTFDVMENHPEWLTDISGITMKKAAQISASFKEQAGLRGFMMFCKDYMTTAQITKVYKCFGGSATDRIRKNPYCLCDSFCGLPFDVADRIAASLGFSSDHEDRLLHGLCYLLNYNASLNGHTCLPREKLMAAAAQLLGVSEERVGEVFDIFLREGRICAFRIGDEVYAMTRDVYMAEARIAAKLHELQSNVATLDREDVLSLIEKVETTVGIRYAALQREALYEAMRQGVMILTGGPGTGKTTVVRAMLSMFRSLGMKTVLAAPTGRAAKRLSEATGEEAKTIHRMLEMERKDDAQTVFNRNERNPIEETVVIVDESSMIDLSLMDALMRALRRRAKLILIGDSNQLPSVGAGNVLADLIACGAVYTVCLTEIFRQSGQSLIVTNAHRIHEGEAPILTATDNDFFFVQREQEATIASAVADLITVRLPKAYGKQICGKIQVITPSRKGVGGVEQLNALLQERINPKGKFKNEKESHGVIFRVGDRVMQICNNYEIEWEKNGVAGAGLFNGDIGVIEQIDMANRSMRVCFDDKTASYGFDQLDELELAYAITVHKSQGSEYPVVVIPLYACPPMLRTRNLFYTAVTRAKEMVILVGQRQIVADMVKNDREILRYTTLKERIAEYFEDNSQRF
ncbi:MAG: ATP-dependent RecD-like DNA helicase [Clostridia bacterium]|nr:ATP-dependent RecD-like DNA helicase [Clostridia bacterium]